MLHFGSQWLAYKALANSINHMLSLDPVAWEQVQRLAGQRLALHLNDLDWTLLIAFTAQGIEIPLKDTDSIATHSSNTKTQDCDKTTQVSGRLQDYLDLIRAEDKQSTLANSEISIQGRSALLIQLAKIAQRWHPDWATAIQPYFGPVLTQVLTQTGLKGQQWFEKTKQQWQQDVQTYCQREQPISPSAIEIKNFADQVDALRARSERLEARIQRLECRNRPGISK